MNTKQKGDVAVAQAIHYYMSNGYEVCLPIGDKRPYDLVVEIDGVLKRVQIKYAGFYKTKNRHIAALRVMGGNRSWHTAKKYEPDDFDELFVYTASGRKFIFPWAEITASTALYIENQKYSQYEIA
jgi:hypothetical protein